MSIIFLDEKFLSLYMLLYSCEFFHNQDIRILCDFLNITMLSLLNRLR